MRQVIYFFLIFISFVPSFVHATSPQDTVYRLSLEQCVERALKNNDQIKAAGYDAELSEARLREARPKGIPVVRYEHRVAPVPGNIDDPADSFFGGDISILNNFKMEFGMPITSFGKIKTAQELAGIGVDASWFQKSKTSDDVILKIHQIYYGILLARELSALTQKAHETVEGKIGEMEHESVIDQLGVLKLKLVLFEVQRRVEEARTKGALAMSALKIQVGLEDDVDLEITSNELTPIPFKLYSLDYYLYEARKYRPEYKLLNAGINAKEKKIKLEELNYAPNLGMGGFFDIARSPGIIGGEDENNFTDPFNFTRAGIGLQLKGEFDYIKTSSKIKQAKADHLKSIYEKRAAVRGLELDIKQSYLNLQAAKSLMDKAEAEMKTARQLVFLTKSNFDIGIGEKKDYLDALQSYLIFQGRQYESIYNYNVAISELKKKIGSLHFEQRKETP